MNFKNCSECCYLYSVNELKSSNCISKELKENQKEEWVCTKYKKLKIIKDFNTKPQDCPLDF